MCRGVLGAWRDLVPRGRRSGAADPSAVMIDCFGRMGLHAAGGCVHVFGGVGSERVFGERVVPTFLRPVLTKISTMRADTR